MHGAGTALEHGVETARRNTHDHAVAGCADRVGLWLLRQQCDLADGFADKHRRDEAVRAARDRGLDAEKRRAEAAARNRRPQTSRARLGRRRFAEILLAETKLPFRDIAGITGLDIYQIVVLKLQMRKAEPTGA